MAVPPPPSHIALVVRPLLNSDPEERERILKDVEYNIFAFPAGLVTCDFLSDSGTSAMTDVQWAALIRGDESYGRNWGYYCLLEAFRDIFERGSEANGLALQGIVSGMAGAELYKEHLLLPREGGFVNGGPYQLTRPNFFIVPQGRCAENLLFSTLMELIQDSARNRRGPLNEAQLEYKTNGAQVEAMQGNPAHPWIIISNGFFDTTGANASLAGFELQTFTQPGLTDPFPAELIGSVNNFKGSLDLGATEAFLSEHHGRVAMILMTITNNWAAAQPVSMANIRGASALAKRWGIPLFFDACRFAENAFFIQRYEDGYAETPIADIVREMFSYADGFTISLKKDGLSNMGGVLSFRDKGLFATKYPTFGLCVKERQILFYGNDSYGGMSGRDIMAAAAGLYQVTKKTYLSNRIGQVQSFAQKLQACGIAVLSPPGGHAVYLDMDEFFRYCDRKPDDFASVGFTLDLLKDYGIRAVEAGPFGWEWDKKSPEEQKKIPNLVRFAVPRHVFSDEHINYTVAAVKELHNRRHSIPNVVITRGKDLRLRHFQSGMKPVPVDQHTRGTYLGEATRQISHLSHAVEQDERSKEQLLSALALAVGKWGQNQVPPEIDQAAWLSDVSNDHAPFEYSVAIDQKTGHTELRFLVEAQPELNNFAALQQSALRLSEDIAAKYEATIYLDWFNLVRDLFITPNAEGNFAAWFSCALSKSGPEWKIYLNPSASGKANALSTTKEALARLSLKAAWKRLETILTPNDFITYFSLDLSPDEEARVKVYVAHSGATASEIAQKHATICPDASTYDIQRFLASMAGGSLGPYSMKPVFSCFAFTMKAPTRPVGTVHFPIEAYVDSDAEAQTRVMEYIGSTSISAAFREKYEKALSAVQRRPLDRGVGIHAWVSLKQKPGGHLSNTFYMSPELFGPLEPYSKDHS